MNLSAKTEYACIAVLELTLQRDSEQPVQVRSIADKHGIPARFLVQILLQLKSAGWVASTRGVAGGYRLAKDPREITLADIRQAVEGRRPEPASNAGVDSRESRVLLAAWRRIAAEEIALLEATTFANLAEAAREPAESMYHI